MKKKNKFFEGLKAGLQDAITHQKGNLDLRTTSIEITETPCDKSDQRKKTKEIGSTLESFFHAEEILEELCSKALKTANAIQKKSKVKN